MAWGTTTWLTRKTPSEQTLPQETQRYSRRVLVDFMVKGEDGGRVGGDLVVVVLHNGGCVVLPVVGALEGLETFPGHLHNGCLTRSPTERWPGLALEQLPSPGHCSFHRLNEASQRIAKPGQQCNVRGRMNAGYAPVIFMMASTKQMM